MTIYGILTIYNDKPKIVGSCSQEYFNKHSCIKKHEFTEEEPWDYVMYQDFKGEMFSPKYKIYTCKCNKNTLCFINSESTIN